MPSVEISLVIASMHPEKLSEFYLFATKGALKSGVNKDHYLIFDTRGVILQIYRPSSKCSVPIKGNSSSLCLQQKPSENPVLTLREWSESLVMRGARIVEEPRFETFGVESWLHDPEGNTFLLFVPSL